MLRRPLDDSNAASITPSVSTRTFDRAAPPVWGDELPSVWGCVNSGLPANLTLRGAHRVWHPTRLWKHGLLRRRSRHARPVWTGPVPLFGNRLGRFWHALGFGAFVGDVHIDGEGFTLVGTGQRPCADGPSFFRTVGHGSNTTDGDSTSPGRFGRSSVRQPRPCADSHALEGTQRITRGHGLNHQSRPESDRPSSRRGTGDTNCSSSARASEAAPRAPLRC
jgi:hypothetical protein